jgi:DNA replication protein DnaC
MNPCATQWQRKWLDLEITHPAIQEVATAAERWFENDRRNSLLVLTGDTGTCKSHVADKIHKFCRAAALRAFDSGRHGRSSIPSVAFLHWPTSASKFFDKSIANAIVEDASNATLRIIDDIGAEKDQWDDAKDKLCQILSRSDEKFTVVTTNIAPKDWAAKFDIRVADRLLRNSVVKELRDVTSFAIWKRLNARKSYADHQG